MVVPEKAETLSTGGGTAAPTTAQAGTTEPVVVVEPAIVEPGSDPRPE